MPSDMLVITLLATLAALHTTGAVRVPEDKGADRKLNMVMMTGEQMCIDTAKMTSNPNKQWACPQCTSNYMAPAQKAACYTCVGAATSANVWSCPTACTGSMSSSDANVCLQCVASISDYNSWPCQQCLQNANANTMFTSSQRSILIATCSAASKASTQSDLWKAPQCLQSPKTFVEASACLTALGTPASAFTYIPYADFSAGTNLESTCPMFTSVQATKNACLANSQCTAFVVFKFIGQMPQYCLKSGSGLEPDSYPSYPGEMGPGGPGSVAGGWKYPFEFLAEAGAYVM